MNAMGHFPTGQTLEPPAMKTDSHTYEPRKGHGLPHDPFNAIVGPRPIGWISSKGASGQVNLAPYSFFNAFNYVPPIIGFSSIGWKDTVRNIQETGEFAWNLATRELANAMNQTCAAVPAEVNEFSSGAGSRGFGTDTGAKSGTEPGEFRMPVDRHPPVAYRQP